MNENVINNIKLKESLEWIIGILRKHKIPFQISGGLAAKIYGSPRPLNDIDINIYEENFKDIKEDVNRYIVFGPAHYKDGKWDLMLMTLDYNGQMIDIGGDRNIKISNKSRTEWLSFSSDLSKAENKVFWVSHYP